MPQAYGRIARLLQPAGPEAGPVVLSMAVGAQTHEERMPPRRALELERTDLAPAALAH
jgi:hypothetical protein